MMTLKVNGRDHQIDADPDTPLLYVLRENLELNAAKFGCGLGQCGSCTVIVDGKAVLSCVTPLLLLEGKPYWDGKFLVRTLAADPSLELDAIVRVTENRFLMRSLRLDRTTRSAAFEQAGNAAVTAGDAAIEQLLQCHATDPFRLPGTVEVSGRERAEACDRARA